MNVDAHSVAEHGQFIYERNVDRSKHVFNQLGHFRDSCRGNGKDVDNRLFVKGSCRFAAGRRDAAHEFGGIVGLEGSVSRVDAFR